MSWRHGQTAILTQVILATIAALLPHLGRGCSTVGHWGPQNPHSVSWFSLRHLVSNWLEPSGHRVVLLSYVHLLPLFSRLFTQVHLLIDGSVEGQYITLSENNSFFFLFKLHWVDSSNFCAISLKFLSSSFLHLHYSFTQIQLIIEFGWKIGKYGKKKKIMHQQDVTESHYFIINSLHNKSLFKRSLTAMYTEFSFS